MNRFWFPIVLLLLDLGLTLWAYPRLPAEIPSAFANVGLPSASTPKWIVIGVDFLTKVLLFIPFLTLSRIQGIQPIYARLQGTLAVMASAILLVLLLLKIGLFANGLGYDVNMLLFAPLGTGLALLFFGNHLQRLKHQEAGTPLAKAFTEGWNQIRFFLARILVGGGLVMLLCALLPPPWSLFVFLLVLGLTLAAAVIGSCIVYRRKHMNQAR